MATMEFFKFLTQSDNPIVALLASIVIMLAGVIVYQWHYTNKKTVPKWAWNSLIRKVDTLLDRQRELITLVQQGIKNK